MPTPPNVGVELVCQRSPEGSATSRPPTPARRSTQRVSAATESAATAAIAFTETEG